MKKIMVEKMCPYCWEKGYIIKGAYAIGQIPAIKKCPECNGHGYILIYKEVPDDVRELPDWNNIIVKKE